MSARGVLAAQFSGKVLRSSHLAHSKSATRVHLTEGCAIHSRERQYGHGDGTIPLSALLVLCWFACLHCPQSIRSTSMVVVFGDTSSVLTVIKYSSVMAAWKWYTYPL